MSAQTTPPNMVKDKLYLTYVLFYLLGTCTLLYKDFFTTATNFWMYKFRDPSMENYEYNSENRTNLQSQFDSVYTIVSSVANVVFIAVALFLTYIKFSIVKTLTLGLFGAMVILAVTTAFSQIDTDTWQMGYFIITLASGFLITGFCTLLLVTVFVMVAQFPPRYISPLLTGHSVAGVFAALIQIFSLSIGSSPSITGLIYFFIGFAFVAITSTVFFVMLKKSNFFKEHLYVEVAETMPKKLTMSLLGQIANKIKICLAALVVVSGSTIIIHPGLTALVVSMDKGNGNEWNDTYFEPTITFLLYYICDGTGREFGSFIGKQSNHLVILALSFVRLSLVPLIMFCNAQPRHHLSVVFDEDYFYIIFVMLFAFSNGYLVNLCAVNITKATTPEERKLSTILLMLLMFLSTAAFSFLNAALINAI